MFLSKRNIMICFAAAITGIAAGVAVNQTKTIQTFSTGEKTIVLDAGHGSPDGGAVGVSGVLEKDINLAIVLKLEEILEVRGVNVILTRTDDSGLHDGSGTIRSMKVTDMNRRLEIINGSGADLFISIHMNSLNDSSVNGLHIFYDSKHESIKMIAEKIQNVLAEATGASSHEVREASSSLYLMKNTSIPGILVECGFLSNPEEEQKLADEEYQSRIAWAIANALL